MLIAYSVGKLAHLSELQFLPPPHFSKGIKNTQLAVLAWGLHNKMYVIYLNYKALTAFVPILHIEIKFMHFMKHSDSPHFSVLFQLVYHHEGAQSQLKPPQMPLLDNLRCNSHGS